MSAGSLENYVSSAYSSINVIPNFKSVFPIERLDKVMLHNKYEATPLKMDDNVDKWGSGLYNGGAFSRHFTTQNWEL